MQGRQLPALHKASSSSKAQAFSLHHSHNVTAWETWNVASAPQNLLKSLSGSGRVLLASALVTVKPSWRHTWAPGSIGLQKFTASGVVLLPACKTQLVFLTKILRHFSASAAWKALLSSSPTTGFPSVKNWDVPKIASCYTAVLSNFEPIIPSKRGDPGTGAGSTLTAQEPPTEPQFHQEGFKEVVWWALYMHSRTGDLRWFTSKKRFFPSCSVKIYWCRPTIWPEIFILIWAVSKKVTFQSTFLLLMLLALFKKK